MVQKVQGRKTYRSMQGKQVDMDTLRKRHELTPAVGNARINARGDELGPGGQIVRKREDVLKEYYDKSPGMKPEAAVRRDTFQPPADAVEKDLTDDWVEPASDENWIEDDEGNFVKKPTTKKGK